MGLFHLWWCQLTRFWNTVVFSFTDFCITCCTFAHYFDTVSPGLWMWRGVWKVRGGFDWVCRQQKQRSGLQRWIKDVLTEHFHTPDKLSAPHVRRMQMIPHLHPHVKHPVNFSLAVFVNELPRAGTSARFISSDPEWESRLNKTHSHLNDSQRLRVSPHALVFNANLPWKPHFKNSWACDLWTNVIYASYLWIFSWEKRKAGQGQDLIKS